MQIDHTSEFAQLVSQFSDHRPTVTSIVSVTTTPLIPTRIALQCWRISQRLDGLTQCTATTLSLSMKN